MDRHRRIVQEHVINVGSSKSLENGASVINGGSVYQYDFANRFWQQWRIRDAGNGSSVISNSHYSRMALDVTGASNAPGARIQQWTYGGAANQHWNITPSSNAAIGASVVTSSSLDQWGWCAGCANDGQRQTISSAPGWTSDGSLTVDHTEWIEFSFASRQINRVDLYGRNDTGNVGVGFPIDFSIQAWTGSAWVTVVSRTGYGQPTSAVQSFSFAPTTASKIRVVGTRLRPDSTPHYRMQLSEVEVY